MKFPFALRDEARFDVVGFGTNAVDHLVRVHAYPAFDTKVEFTSQTIEPGGEVASTLVGLERLGLTTAYAGSFGGDANGEIGRRSLDDAGIDLTHSRTVPGAETQTAFIIIDETSGERSIIWRRDPLLAYTADEAPLDAVRDCRVLHLTPHDTAAACE